MKLNKSINSSRIYTNLLKFTAQLETRLVPPMLSVTPRFVVDAGTHVYMGPLKFEKK